MPDFKKTVQLYVKEGLEYPKQPHEKAYENWYTSVTNQHKKGRSPTGKTAEDKESFYYYQIEELRSSGLVPPDFGEDRKDRFDSTKLKRYPEKIVRSIIRVQDANGKEWIKSKQMWTAMDRLGNEILQDHSDLETYEDPQFKYEYKHKDPTDPLSPMERKPVAGTEHVRRYTMPFTEENLNKLLAIRPAKDMRSVNLTVMKIDSRGQRRASPYVVESLDDFKNRPFDELYDWLSAPHSKIDTILGRSRLDKDKDDRHYR